MQLSRTFVLSLKTAFRLGATFFQKHSNGQNCKQRGLGGKKNVTNQGKDKKTTKRRVCSKTVIENTGRVKPYCRNGLHIRRGEWDVVCT